MGTEETLTNIHRGKPKNELSAKYYHQWVVNRIPKWSVYSQAPVAVQQAYVAMLRMQERQPGDVRELVMGEILLSDADPPDSSLLLLVLDLFVNFNPVWWARRMTVFVE